jgi:hypothetical protein
MAFCPPRTNENLRRNSGGGREQRDYARLQFPPAAAFEVKKDVPIETDIASQYRDF